MERLVNMRFCIFNSLPQHHEMFAHVLDYFKERNVSIDIYTNKINHYGWLDFYEKNFSIISWFPISFFNPDAYDYVFLLTDDDKGYAPFWNDKTRVIVTEHSSKRQLNLRSYFTIQTREFKLRNPPSDPNTWILPVWNNKLDEKYEKLKVLSIGNATNGINLPSLFSNFSDIQFILVDRHMDISEKGGNITRYNCLDATRLIEFAAKSHYIIFWPTSAFSMEHKHNSMSGSFALACSVGTPLILPESFIEPLGLEAIGIPDSPLKPIHLEKPSDTLVSAVLKQREDLLKRRDRIFDSLFGYSNKKMHSSITSSLQPSRGMYTAVMVEPRKHGAMEFVLKNFLENLDARWNFMLFHGTTNKEWLDAIISKFPSDTQRIKLVSLGIPSMDLYSYSKLLTSADFIEQIPTETFLIFQTDTMISPAGKDLIYDFIDYDYVGAPWPRSYLRESCNVGNGGLSLRKKSKMLEIIKSKDHTFHPEDLFYCINHTVPLYKPTWEKAKLFSIESIYSPRTFGLHKAWKHIPIKDLEEQFPGISQLKVFDEGNYN
jgi:hypothetical protein